MENNREQWSSKASFILAAAGSAVGLGNIWKFPYIAGENGGAAFLFIYLICIVLIGLPILNIEILLGRTTKKNPVGAFKTLASSPFWKYVGIHLRATLGPSLDHILSPTASPLLL